MDALRSALQPITHNLPTPIFDLGVSLLGSSCYKKLILDIKPLDNPECVKLAVSKALGLGIVGASAVVKVPQLLKLLNSQSAAGVSFLSYLLETSSYLITLAYNARQGNPFSTYGESALIAVQNVAIATLVLHYSGQSAGAAAFIAGLGAAVYAMFNEGIVDGNLMTNLQVAAGGLGVASKIPQILTIWRQGGTGQLSAFAVFNFLIGSLTRIFTTLQEVNDPLILYSFVAAFGLNLVLALQMIYYWNSPSSKTAASGTKLQNEKAKEKLEAPVAATTATPKKGASTRRRG